jgi:hypothetical protein
MPFLLVGEYIFRGEQEMITCAGGGGGGAECLLRFISKELIGAFPLWPLHSQPGASVARQRRCE